MPPPTRFPVRPDSCTTARRQEARLAGISPEVVPTQDGRSFLLVWEPQALKGKPHQWIVSLHAATGSRRATWRYGVLSLKTAISASFSLQWWFGGGEKTGDYYSPFDIYRELDLLDRRMGIKPATRCWRIQPRFGKPLCGSRAGSQQGQRYFSLFVANSGRASLIIRRHGRLIPANLATCLTRVSRWITSCGERDTNSGSDGCPGMRRTGEWLKKLGAESHLRSKTATKATAPFTAIPGTQTARWTGFYGIRNNRGSGFLAHPDCRLRDLDSEISR